MNKYIGASLYHSKEKKCSNCGMDKSKSNGCCKDEHKVIKLKREHQQVSDKDDFSILKNVVLVPVLPGYSQITIPSTSSDHISIHPPPDFIKQDICILNRIFLI
jgi:hypothetical protein